MRVGHAETSVKNFSSNLIVAYFRELARVELKSIFVFECPSMGFSFS